MGRPFASFVYGIAAHKVADAMRTASKLAIPTEDLPDGPDDRPGPEETVVGYIEAERARSLLARLPLGWRPDAVFLSLCYTTLPRRLWAAPVPLIGVAADWGLLWHGYRRVFPLCERVLTDAMAGDATLFARQDYVEEAWRIVDPILQSFGPVMTYEPHTWGPSDQGIVPPGGWDDPKPEVPDSLHVVEG